MSRNRHHPDTRIEHEILEVEERELHVLEEIERDVHPHRYSVTITQEKEHHMAIGNITAGQTGTFQAALNDNGSPVALPTGSTFVWACSDPLVTFNTSTDTTSTVVTVGASDTAASVTITASTTDPTGATQTGTITVPVTSAPQQFTVSITQTA